MNDLECMKLSIAKASEIETNKLRVGIAIKLYNNEVIEAISTENNSSDWVYSAINKLNDLKVDKVKAIYLTINTLLDYGDFDVNLLLQEIPAHNIYIGLPDPKLYTYKENDPMLTEPAIKRYPDDLQRRILELNSQIYTASKQSIQLSPYYSDVRISRLVLHKLQTIGIDINEEIIKENKTLERLKEYLNQNHNMNIKKAELIVNDILSEAFNEKYSHYDYNQDARSVSSMWIKDFTHMLTLCDNVDLLQKKIVNLGVGSGEEAKVLFSNCKNITFIDIAPDGLKKNQNILPWSTILQSRAENLGNLKNNSYDTYISLRTYNSSFFDTALALSEAYRILANNGTIILSVANGFRCVNNSIIPGLIIPNAEFVDIYRGLNLAKALKDECEKIGFSSINIYPTITEIYIIGKVVK